MSYICKYNQIFSTATHFLILLFSALGHFRYNVCKEITSSVWHNLQAQISSLLYVLRRRGLCVRAEAGDRSGQGIVRCWGNRALYVCIFGFFWGCGGALPLQLRGQQLRVSRQGETIACVVEETRCEVPVFSRRKERRVEVF